jgi:lysozyme family protein
MSPVAIPDVIQANSARWPQMVVDFDATPTMNDVAAKLVANKARYQALFAATKVPWPAIAVIHERECSQRWDLSIAQGDPWNAVSVHVPKGRGPFNSWEEAAVDALTQCDHMDEWSHWDTMGGVLTRLEMYNGLGYASRNLPSPYVWARTSPYEAGKFTSDGVFNADVVDSQEGCAPLLAAMMALDPTILTDFGWDAPPAQPSLTGPDGTVHNILWLQTTLNQLGASPQLHPDGGWGPRTMAALTTYQTGAGLPANGRYNVPTLQSLENAVAGPAPAPPSQA